MSPLHACPSCLCESGHRLPTSLEPAPAATRRWERELEAALAAIPDCPHSTRPQVILDGARNRSLCGRCALRLVPEWARETWVPS